MRNEEEIRQLISEIREDLEEKGYPAPEKTIQDEWERLAEEDEEDGDAIIQREILDHLEWCLGEEFFAVRQKMAKLARER